MSGLIDVGGGEGTAAAAGRAAAAEQAVTGRHLRAVWGLPGTALGTPTWPAALTDRLFSRWNYWWQAHLLDCLLDAEHRAPDPARRTQINALIRGHRLRNAGRWTNDYFDDMAWLGLVLQRASRVAGPHQTVARHGTATLSGVLRNAWDQSAEQGIPWRRGDTLRNAPANGPAGLLLARLGDLPRAQAVADWLHTRLRDPVTGLVLDRVRDGGAPEPAVYTYCQGVALGLETELARRTGHPRHHARACRLIDAVAEHLAPGGVLTGCGDGDGGLFAGITSRYLARAALSLDAATPPGAAARALGAELVRTSAAAAWATRRSDGLSPRFSVDWARPGTGSPDLSVQLSAWMVLEAHTDLVQSAPVSSQQTRVDKPPP